MKVCLSLWERAVMMRTVQMKGRAIIVAKGGKGYKWVCKVNNTLICNNERSLLGTQSVVLRKKVITSYWCISVHLLSTKWYFRVGSCCWLVDLWRKETQLEEEGTLTTTAIVSPVRVLLSSLFCSLKTTWTRTLICCTACEPVHLLSERPPVSFSKSVSHLWPSNF